MSFRLFNKRFNTFLTHPKIGVWTTQSFEEAQEMLQTCVSYVKTLNIPNYSESFIIIDDEELCLMESHPQAMD